MDLHIIYQRDKPRGWVAHIPELHVLTKGTTHAEARSNAVEAARFTINCLAREKQEPEPVEIEALTLN